MNVLPYVWLGTRAETPFRHMLVDDWWDPFLIEMVRDEVNLINEEAWTRVKVALPAGHIVEDKDSISFDRCAVTRCIRELHQRLASPAFITWLEMQMGIPALHFDTLGGGLHRIRPGGQLGVHVDFNVDEQKRWRRVNVLIYLNVCGKGGELRLYDEQGEKRVISPRRNRMVVFECSERSWHGHPRPLQGTSDRLSVAAYYFTKEAPPDAVEPHSTVWRLPS